MSRNEKMKFIRLIEGSELCISDALVKYDVPRSTYYRWKRKLKSQGIRHKRFARQQALQSKDMESDITLAVR